MLYFLTGALSYATGIGAIQNNKYLKLAILLIIFWAILLSQLKGTKYTSLIARIGFVAGILLPALVLFGLGIPLCRFRRSTTNDTVYENIDS